MNAIRQKIKRRLSIKDEKHAADYSADEADDETTSHLQSELDEAMKEGHAQGKPGSLLNKLIAHGNKKTDAQLAQLGQAQGQGNEKGDGGDGVIR